MFEYNIATGYLRAKYSSLFLQMVYILTIDHSNVKIDRKMIDLMFRLNLQQPKVIDTMKQNKAFIFSLSYGLKGINIHKISW